MNSKSITIILGLVLLTTLSCRLFSSSAKPEHYGVYLKNGNKLIELKEFEGPPESNKIGDILAAPDNQPAVIVWLPDLNLDNFYLVTYKAGGDKIKEEINYIATPKENDILEIRPQESLAPDIYCFMKADPLGVSYFFPNYCFQVGEVQSEASTIVTEIPLMNTPEVIPTAQIIAPTEDQLIISPSNPANLQAVLEWDIGIGDIVKINVADDGTIYGLLSNIGSRNIQKLVIISPNGEITKIIDLPNEIDCYEIKGLEDGTIYCMIHSDITRISTSGEPQKIEVGEFVSIYWTGYNTYYTWGQDELSFWEIDGKKIKDTDVSGWNRVDPTDHWKYWEGYGELFYNDQSFAFTDFKGDLVKFNIPDGLLPNDTTRGWQFTIAPWGDLYLFYNTYDAIGNNTGEKFSHVDLQGNIEQLDYDPIYFYKFNWRYGDQIVDRSIFLKLFSFIPSRDEIYFCGYSLVKLDHNLNVLSKITNPLDYYYCDYSFIGNDGALYVPHDNKLLKYKLQ